ncbi:CRISPR-associated endonuclease Cas2 [Prevotella nigrescens]|uniref:CRISPR-associated endonuclease Cas2 n=1 Tax=Prevotella nigrescens TaxID=28133 RepID=UPI0028E7DEBD|nr:CRISPR-associated endonuclease Cas2 [Prevotella nigrescens]
MRKQLPYIEILRKLNRAGVEKSPTINREVGNIDNIPTLNERINFLLGIVNKTSRPATNMLFFVMYDIASNKVRYHIAKYLERKGCTRIQHSIFLADLDKAVYDEIKSNLAEVQALYDNNDSIIVCPVSTDQLKAMKVIGEDINIDVILRSNNTLFF